jgi:hypothetical protein
MSTKESDPKKIIAAVTVVHGTLEPFTLEERKKIITMATVLFGEPAPSVSTLDHRAPEVTQQSSDGISGKALAWMKKNSIEREQLEHVFAIENDSIDVIASRMPASSKRQNTVHAYVICGLASFLKTGEPVFTDNEGRAVCQRVGCYDQPNHSNYCKAFGNLINGSKDAGWKLTNPGLSEAAKLVRQLAPAGNA